MHSEHATMKSRLLGRDVAVHAATDKDECQRRLGRVYRLILSYEPKEMATTQNESADAPGSGDTIRLAAG